jgi:hypothetical protein
LTPILSDGLIAATRVTEVAVLEGKDGDELIDEDRAAVSRA